jgi:coproporphyrinogen III oxidase-like Fe-S oxidoreductase
MPELLRLQDAWLIGISEHGIHVQPAGRLLVRAIAMIFHRYLREDH